MKAVITLCLFAAFGLSSCATLCDQRPLAHVDRDRGPLKLDQPERERPIRRNGDEPGLLGRAMPWNWFE